MKTFVIGDIHGNIEALNQCLKRSNIDFDKDTLITLGDFADGYDYTFDCIEKILEIKNRIDIKGNHDIWLEEFLQYGRTPSIWLQNGGKTSIKSYENRSEEDKDNHLKFLRGQHYYYVDDENRAFVHGGYTSPDGLGNDDLYDYTWDRDLWDIALSGNVSQTIPKILRHYSRVFIGHTSTVYRNKTDLPLYKSNVWNIDNGGGGGGKLTIMDVDTEEYWQSDKIER